MLWAVFLVPLVLLLLLGFAIAGGKGAAAGILVYAIGLAILFLYGSGMEATNAHEANKQGLAWSDACLREAGETGQPISFRPHKIFINIDARVKDFSPQLTFDDKEASPLVELVSSYPPKLTPDEIFISVNLIDRAIEGAGTRRLQGFETSVFDTNSKVVGKRVNFIRTSDACFQEDEKQAVDRFLRRILGLSPVLMSSQMKGRSEVLVE